MSTFTLFSFNLAWRTDRKEHNVEEKTRGWNNIILHKTGPGTLFKRLLASGHKLADYTHILIHSGEARKYHQVHFLFVYNDLNYRIPFKGNIRDKFFDLERWPANILGFAKRQKLKILYV